MSESSGDEVREDGLQIKPPQPHRPGIRTFDDRNQRRWGTGRIETGSRTTESRRRDRGQYYDQQRGDRSHGPNFRSQQRLPDIDVSRVRRVVDDDRNRKNKYENYVTNPRRDPSEPHTSRIQNELRRLDQEQPRRGDHRSKQLHKSVKHKRKHLELEEHKALREIEKRHRKERKDEQERSSSGTTDKRRRKHEPVPPHSPSPPHSPGASDHEEEQDVNKTKSSEELEEDMPIVEDIVKSSPEVEEDEEKSNSQLEPRPYHSDVSSESEVEAESKNDDENTERQINPPSQASSKSVDSDSSSSKSESESEDSSDSKSSEESEDDDKKKNDSKTKSEDNYTPPSTNIDESDKAVLAGSSDVEILDTDKKVDPQTVDESLLTDVDRAIREVSLLSPYFPAVQGCRRVEEFSLLNRIEEGTYGVVYRAKDRRTNEVVALKRLKMEKEKDGFPITSLREINTLLKAQHENVVTVREIVVGSNTDKIFLVMDYVEHDLKSLMETLKQKSQMFLLQEVKCLLIQLLRAVAHLHDNWILHRDLKTSNLLLSHKGILKVGDFGLAREYGSPLKSYTPIVVTLWYRAPELLLGIKEYSTPIDVWSVGCIFGELVKMEPMFPGKSEANQLNLIFQTLGTPNDRIWPGYSRLPLLQRMTFVDQPMNKLKTRFGGIGDKGIDLMNKLLTYNPAKRITAEDALNHIFFKESPLPIDPSIFPTWPAKSELGHRKAPSSPKPPSGGRQFKELTDDDDSSGFFLGTGTGDRRLPMGAGFSLKF